MLIFDYILIGFGLAMDAFAVSICKGLSFSKLNFKKAFIVATYFSLFQMLMPIIGYFLGNRLSSAITRVDNYIAFFLIASIGVNMLIEGFKKEDKEEFNDDISIKTMIVLAIATSLDALAVGVTFAFLKISIIEPIISIGVITFLLSLLGVKIGNVFGEKYKKHAQIAGGVILILIAIKILFEN